MNTHHYERQWARVGYQTIVPDDFDGTNALELLSIPEGAMLSRIVLNVKTAYTGGTIRLGDAQDDDRYGATLALTAGLQNIPITGYEYPVDTYLTATGTAAVGNSTAGEFDLWIEYWTKRVADEVQE